MQVKQMIGETDFDRMKTVAGMCNYSSLEYAEFVDCRDADVVYHDDHLIILCDRSKTPCFLHFAADNFDRVIEQINKIEAPLRINFVPHEHTQKLFDIGFEIWGEYNDYFNKELKTAPIESYHYHDIEFLQSGECQAASLVSKKCEGQSRGFGGETAEWFAGWVAENSVIVVRENGEIAGYCCVAIYSEGTTLWIREIAVNPKYQGKGYGKKLMEQAICYGIEKGAEKGFLAVDTINKNAIHLYEKYGFAARGGLGELQMIRR
jgi:ribosomal protein S18 acetylase RimI-like enzyme